MFESLWNSLVEFQRAHPHALKALLAGTFVSTVCGVVGCFIILRRMAFLADALAHALLAGVVGGFLLLKLALGQDADSRGLLLGALLAGLFTVAVIGFVTRVSRVKEDTAIGIMYTGVFALGGLLASLFSRHIHLDLLHFITGEVLAVGDDELWLMALVASGVFGVVLLFYRQLQLVSFDRVMAASIGVPVLALDYLLTGCASLVVVSGVNIVGVVLVVGLMITPAATAYLLCDRLPRMLACAALFGWTAFLGGYWLAGALETATGSTIVVVCTGQFLVVLAAAPKHGLIAKWLRRRWQAPETLMEDMLGYILRAPGETPAAAEVLAAAPDHAARARRALRALEQRKLVTRIGERVALTEAGRHEARRLLRAHRLWESYLQSVGEPAAALHAEAHRLEHLHDEETVDYLDDRLGHPLKDPHGAEIPEDFVHLAPGAHVQVSLLRAGHRGEITRLPDDTRGARLRLGQVVRAGPRRQEDNQWRLRLESGEETLLDHALADAVWVRLLPPEETPAQETPSAEAAGFTDAPPT